MFIDFSVSNFRSIASEQVLSLLPDEKIKHSNDSVVSDEALSALVALALYGPNNSGKSTLINGLSCMLYIVRESASWNSTVSLPFEPNQLIKGYPERPSEFALTFSMAGVRYRYGFTYDRDCILSEWLYRKKTGREVSVFLREGDTIDVSAALEGGKKVIDAAIEATRDNALFLSVGDVFNLEILSTVFGYLDNVLILDGLNSEHGALATKNTAVKQAGFLDLVNKYFGRFDLGIQHLSLSEENDNGERYIRSAHEILNEDGTPTGQGVYFDMNRHESSGTQKIFEIIAPIALRLEFGGTIVIDEIEAKLHTKLTAAIVRLFTDRTTNPKGAQLIFATHDTNLLETANLRRDQINFVEKGKAGATRLYALSDFRYFKGNKTRPDKDVEKRYLEGRYGAVPEVDFEQLATAL